MENCNAVGIFAILEEMQSIYSEVQGLTKELNDKRARFAVLQKEIDKFIGFEIDSFEKANEI